MPYQTITLSSGAIANPSTPAVLNWRCGAPTSVLVYTSTTGTSSGSFQIQYTLDDLQLVFGTSNAKWVAVSSAIGVTGQTFNASASVDGTLIQFQTPIAAVRVNATSLSSGPITMKVIQGESW